MKKRYVCLLLTAAAAVCIAGGCGGQVTAESVLSDMSKNMEAKNSVEGTMSFSFEGNIAQESAGTSVSVDMNMELSADIQSMLGDTQSSYMNGTIDMSVMGINIAMPMEVYTVSEDGAMVSYTGIQEQWIKAPADESQSSGIDEGLFSSDYESLIDDGSAVVVLSDETKQIEGKECYEVTMSLQGEAIEEILGASMNMAGSALDGLDEEAMDWSGASQDCLIYIDTEDKLPVRAEADMTDLLNRMYEAMEGDVSAEISTMKISIVYNGFDTVDGITVPEEVKASAVESDSSDGLLDELESEAGAADAAVAETDENGNYILSNYEGTYTAVIAPVEGYELSYASQNSVSYINDETDLSYSFYDYTTSEDMMAYYSTGTWLDNDENYSDYEISEMQQTDVGNLTVSWYKETYTYMDTPFTEYCAWVSADEQTQFTCDISYVNFDDTTQIDDTIIETAFRNVSLS